MALSFEYKLLKWGYSERNGPKAWCEWYPISNQGKRQSPIDIKPHEAEEDPGLKVTPLKASYDVASDLLLENTGVSWQLHFHDQEISSLTGGPLDSQYKVTCCKDIKDLNSLSLQIVQMHAHWGKDGGAGSEHTVDGLSYEAELHIVHYNTKYSSAGEAFEKPDGLAVLGIFLKVGKTHPELEKVFSKLKNLDQVYDTTSLDELLEVDKILPADKSYFTYPGSLTTPPLHESVTWIVFKQPIEMSEDQVSFKSINEKISIRKM